MSRPKRPTASVLALDGTVIRASEYSEYHQDKAGITTWVTRAERDLLFAIANASGVTVAAYFKAIIADVLAEEGPKVKTVFTLEKQA